MAKHVRKKRSAGRRILVFLLLVLFCAGFFRWSNRSLQVERFTFTSSRLPQGFDGCTIVVLADLHGAVFGKDNQRLLDTVSDQAPDMILLAGVDDPNGYADQKTPEELAQEVRSAWGDGFWILLAHRNNLFPRQYSLLGADLVIAGHGHGGMIRLPFTDGLISVERTLFPSYTAGFYEENGSTAFVSRGLGNSGPSFRLFNRPQIAVLTLEREP